MPVFNLDFTGVQSFDNLPIGKYPGSIDKIELKPATGEGKFDQLQVTYLCTDGEFMGRKQSEFLSMSPKAAFRLKRWFDKFGLGEGVPLDVDDETNLLMEPDLVGVDVEFRVYEDPKLYLDEHQIRCELTEVFDSVAAPAPTPVARTAAPATRQAAPSAQADEETEEVEEEAPAPAKRNFAARPAATAAAGPARRKLQ
jgi:hypothetical protein